MDVDVLDHERFMERALTLAREAADRGDEPFGSLLVHDGEVIIEERNAVNTADDIRRHPELTLARRAARDLSIKTRRETVMYTSTEPCPMCAGGMRQAGFDRVVYSVGSDDLAEYTGEEPATRSSEILRGVTAVVGPVLNEAGRQVHEEFDW